MSDARAKILIVDDESSIRDILFRVLSQADYHCVAGATPDEAITLMQRDEFDVALLDLLMPGMSGLDLIREIKQHTPDTAVIMITPADETETAVEAMRLGAYDYFVKPFLMDKVILGVERALEFRRLTLENRQYQQNLEDRVLEQSRRILQPFVGAIEGLVRAMESKDNYTRGHTERVVELALMTAREMGLAKPLEEQVRLGALLHDIGKIGIKESILLKPGSLTSAEYAHLTNHVSIGVDIVRTVLEDPEVLRIVRTHHERYDGNGVLDGLKGEAIPMGARIISVADAFDAMISDRPYRLGRPEEEARVELTRCSGDQFDPEIVNAFLRALDRRGPLDLKPQTNQSSSDVTPWQDVRVWK